MERDVALAQRELSSVLNQGDPVEEAPAVRNAVTQPEPAPSAPVESVTPSMAPVSSLMRTPPNRLQLIDESQQFDEDAFREHLHSWGLAEAGFGYDICAVLGSQSTGKSTLLNRLFGTNFDVMDERARQQTTKGIWLCRGLERNVLVMDVEGTDGRERGEDQDFERKSALFALTTAECLIVNMWENQVGLYQGANMGLLKTVLDVNLSLFQAGRARAGGAKEKTLLLFVIRDFLGTTPLENLEATVRADLQRIWASLTKPEALADAALGDFFDVMFATLPHKVLQAKEFDAGIMELQRRFLGRGDENYVFQTQYHKRIPIDGLPHYLKNVWAQVVENKDLDLPTQQELLAQFRCDEIASAASQVFSSAISALRTALETGQVLPSLGTDMLARRTEALSVFDRDASRYHQGVYARKRADLLLGLNAKLLPFFLGQLKNLLAQLTTQFQQAVRDGMSRSSYDFGALVQDEHAAALRQFDAETQTLVLPETDWKVDDERAQLSEELNAMARTMRAEESRKLAASLEKEMRRQLAEPVELALAHPAPDMWDAVMQTLQRVNNEATAAFRARAARLQGTPEEEESAVQALQSASWRLLQDKVREQTSDAVLSMRLRSYFEDRFRYDAGGVPRVWKPSDDMEGMFVQARDSTLELIALYATIAPSEPSLLLPAAHAAAAADDSDASSFEESLHVLSELKRTELGNRFRRDADAYYVEAKRSMVSSMSQVPVWVYAVMVVLGWNEAMAIIRNPLYCTVLCLLLAGAYVTWRLHLAAPLWTVAAGLAREVQQVAQGQLRAYLEMPQTTAPMSEPFELRERVASDSAAGAGAGAGDESGPRLPASF
ncbi:Dynamin-like GTPase that mediates homotypic ER fusion [Malassezia caprae]|uniref:Dynamin-like GTPase that mediates homotypic ER fusion n=1 Tax=Malassezia caprae TaxID=1381934 RepID=A0AAF0E8T4_9BASI|nr:Dynamin-like GTPase that mediates homotypic ER fusion [Malassezia caprae]